MFNLKSKKASIWDKKAKKYNRFSNDKDSFQSQILEKIAQRGISFKDKTVLDIGCGTGVYTLHIAKDALHVEALDFSQEMLDILKIDAQNEGLVEKFTFTCSTWGDFKTDKRFDIIFSSMSPALQNSDDFAKMNTKAKEYCVYLGWGGKRKSTLLDPIFQAHGQKLKVPSGSEVIRKWLDKQSIKYISEYIEESRLHVKPYDEALESVLWHFEINDVVPNKALVQSVLQPMQDENGNVSFQTDIGVELISWKK